MQKVRVAAEDALLAMCIHEVFGSRQIVNNMVRAVPKANSSKSAKKTMNSNK